MAEADLYQTAPVYTFRLHPRDDHGARALGELRDKGINLVANAVAQSADHIDDFLKMLQTELAFYVGCLNLSEQLSATGRTHCVSSPHRHTSAGTHFRVCTILAWR